MSYLTFLKAYFDIYWAYFHAFIKSFQGHKYPNPNYNTYSDGIQYWASDMNGEYYNIL